MSKSSIRIETYVYFGVERHSIQFHISDEFDEEKIKKCRYLCQYVISSATCGGIGALNGDSLTLSSNTSPVIILTGLTKKVVRELAECIKNIIDAETIEEVEVDAR